MCKDQQPLASLAEIMQCSELIFGMLFAIEFR